MKASLGTLAGATGLCGIVLAFFPWTVVAGQQTPSPKRFGGSFAELSSEQQRLITEWVGRYSRLTGEAADASDLYDSLRSSQRTTFDAVTHALSHTSLTDANGQQLGTALDLVLALEHIAGEEAGVGGDKQFRLYVLLKPGALRIVVNSREFVRERDNTIYHHGYPYSFRMTGTPSVQISGSRDFSRADIDVDYRSSDFPKFLFDGHLSAANSDVRAGDNLERHDQRWAGLVAWWRGLFGFLTPTQPDEQSAEETAIPPNPRIESKQLGEAVHDFLSSLFIEQKPNLAAAYFSFRSYGCVDRNAAAQHKEVEPGMTRVYLLRELQEAAQAAGKPASLEDIVQPVSLSNPRLKPMRNEYRSLFGLYEVPHDLAAAIDCSDVRETASGKNGNYYGAAFRTKIGAGNAAYLLWEKEGKYWKIVAFSIVDSSGGPRLRVNLAAPPPPAAEMARVVGNAEAVKAMRDFLKQWFEKQDYSAALSYLSPRSRTCLAESGAPERQNLSQEQADKIMGDGFRLISRAVGKRKLSKAIESVTPSHEMLRIVRHGEEKSFSVVELPDALGDWFLCRPPGQETPAPELNLNPDQNVYGHYYGMMFRLKAPGPETATLQTLWAQEDDGWRIVAWHTENP